MKLTKVQIVAEFVIEDGDFMEPGIFGPVRLTPREYTEFDLQEAIAAAIAEAEPSRSTPH